MHSLGRTQEQRWSFQQAIVMCFVDFVSALDYVARDFLWRIMAADGMPPKLLRLIEVYYSSAKMKVRASGSDSGLFEARSGVRQGYAPTLFPLQLHNRLDSWTGSTRLTRGSGWS